MQKNFVDLSEKDISIQANKKFSKKEKILLEFLLKNKEGILENNISISILKTKKITLLR